MDVQRRPVPLDVVLSRMTPEEQCEALALLHRCARLGTIDRADSERLTRRILRLQSTRPVPSR